MFAAAAALFVGAEASAAQPQSTIFYNGKVFTAGDQVPDDQTKWPTAVAVQGRKIVAVGDDAHVLAHAHHGTKLVDLQGRTMVPGLNDAHVHILNPPGPLVDDPSFIPGPGPTLSEVLDDIAAATQMYPKGTWLVALVGTNITDDPNVNRFALDVVSPDHPVRLQAWTGHGTVLNSLGMQVLGISDVSADPFAGNYDHVDGSDELNGVMHEYAEYDVRRRSYQLMTDADVVKQYQSFAQDAIQLGFTSVQDIPIGLRQTRSVAILDAADLPLRVRSICFPMTPDEPCEALGGDDDSSLVTFAGIKWITDGTFVERAAFVREPYADAPDKRGQFNLPNDALHQILRRARHGAERRHQVLFHAVGDASDDTILDALDDSGGPCTWNDRRPRIEHGDMLTPDNFDRALDEGVVIVQNGTHLALPDIIHARVTQERAETIQPLRSLLDAGIPLALGTDGIGHVQNPWVDIALVMIHPDNPAEGITIEQAIKAYTHGSAYAEFEEHRKGTIAPGMLADLAVLSQDVFTIQDPTAVMGTSSVLTMVDGQVVWNAGVVGP